MYPVPLYIFPCSCLLDVILFFLFIFPCLVFLSLSLKIRKENQGWKRGRLHVYNLLHETKAQVVLNPAQHNILSLVSSSILRELFFLPSRKLSFFSCYFEYFLYLQLTEEEKREDKRISHFPSFISFSSLSFPLSDIINESVLRKWMKDSCVHNEEEKRVQRKNHEEKGCKWQALIRFDVVFTLLISLGLLSPLTLIFSPGVLHFLHRLLSFPWI